MIRIKYPELELSFLPNSEKKGLLLPPIYVTEDDIGCGGYYEHAREDMPRGCIVVVGDNRIQSALAHEFRHFWQQFNTGLPEDGSDWDGIYANREYEEAIRIYFLSQPCELDALLFEYKYARDEINDEWMELIQ